MATLSKENEELSRNLCKILDYVGLSEDMRKVWMEYGLATEAFLALRTHFMKRPLDMFKFGSGIEGSTIPGLHSDLDLLLLHDIPVVSREEEAPENGICYLLVCDPETPAGFVKFHVVKDGVRLTEAENDTVQPADNYAVDKHGRLVRNNKTLLQDKLNNAWRSGPAQTCEDKNFGSIDYVEAYHCSSWPETASEWLRAHYDREKNTIVTIDQLEDFKTMGCFFVGIGHPKSSESNIEWRISLSSQERSLMFNLTEVQFKCYVMLKIIKEEFIKPSTEKSLSSYHCKTAVFHVVETEDETFWTEGNLVGAVFRCLNVLLQWVKRGECPNFFVQDENMFARTLHGDNREKLETVLKDIIRRGYNILFDIKCDKIGVLLTSNSDHFKTGDMSVEALENLYRIHLDTMCEFSQSKDRIQCLLAADSNPEQCTDRLEGLLNDLQKMKSLTLHDVNGILAGIQYFIPHAQTCLGSNLIARALNNRNDESMKRALIERGTILFHEGSDTYFLSGKLKYACCLLNIGQIQECLDILLDLEKGLQPTTTAACACRHIKYSMNQHLVQALGRERSSTRNLAHTAICMCVCFQLSEMGITPYPLQYEMFRSVGTPDNSVGGFGVYWYQSACVDAKVFLYFLKYLVHAALNDTPLKRESVARLIQIAEEEQDLNHRETAFNLLSWVYKCEGFPNEAIRYCIKSWRYLVEAEEQVTSSVHPHHNAVKWHVIGLLNDTWRKTESRD